MEFPAPLTEGTLERRYKRFLADVTLPGGEVVVAHCPNPGSMKTCAEPGWRAWVSPALNPNRKLAWTLEIVESPTASILVNTARPNAVVKEGIEQARIPELRGYPTLRTEVRYGEEKSRIDLLLESPEAPPCFVEVKSATLLVAPGIAAFPDSVTTRGTRHLRELIRVVEDGGRGVLFFLVGRSDAREVRPADHIDPLYGKTLREAAAAGGEILAWRAEIRSNGLGLDCPLPVNLEP